MYICMYVCKNKDHEQKICIFCQCRLKVEVKCYKLAIISSISLFTCLGGNINYSIPKLKLMLRFCFFLFICNYLNLLYTVAINLGINHHHHHLHHHFYHHHQQQVIELIALSLKMCCPCFYFIMNHVYAFNKQWPSVITTLSHSSVPL